MITVTNRIKVKKGMAMKMAPNFAKPGPLQQFEGFEKVEVLVSTQFEEYDEMSVVMYWASKENFEAWRESDAFKETHKRPAASTNGEQAESPMLGSQIVVAEVAASVSK
ncbi:heme-degrading monooxygenase IsdG [Solibacillus sp. R5-41]|uniref:heme oxygenase n=1 Tax=Solibacillus sp. R5-41 TaxID=2048654 RepID=UPI000C124D1F|nr:heme oxygenase [Solibacillus sp. R5-41]ATP39541.1 heme-degrading monooxygenase IsdG [Solibacillus sp. R5-41]